MKNSLCAGLGVAGSYIAGLFGGWNTALTTLMIFMGIDYLSGLIVAGVFHSSPKSKSGALESRAGLKGLLRKGMCLLVVLVAARLDLLVGGQFIRDGVVIAFIANEALSIIENVGLMGVKMPESLTRAIDILKDREKEGKS